MHFSVKAIFSIFPQTAIHWTIQYAFESVVHCIEPYGNLSKPLSPPNGSDPAFKLNSCLIFISMVPLSACKIGFKILATEIDIAKF